MNHEDGKLAVEQKTRFDGEPIEHAVLSERFLKGEAGLERVRLSDELVAGFALAVRRQLRPCSIGRSAAARCSCRDIPAICSIVFAAASSGRFCAAVSLFHEEARQRDRKSVG